MENKENRIQRSEIRTVKISSVDDFFKKTDRFSERVKTLGCRPKKGIGVLYRGQANAKWGLTTTLERSGFEEFPLRQYIEFLKTQSYLRQEKWSLAVQEFRDDSVLIPIPVLKAFSYIRHIGGPSPLLDWTRNRDKALFFAFHNVSADLKAVSVFMYLDGIERGHAHCSACNLPVIHAIPENHFDLERMHDRHIRQESQYTYCFLGGGRTERRFVPHEGRMKLAKQDPLFSHSDICMKFDLPISLRQDVLKYLAARKINEYELFGSEGARVRTEWQNVFGFQETRLERAQKEAFEMKYFLKLNGL